ncbi:reverse transcriptase domain-containing protein [Tanacetum coccineum]
MAEEDEEKTVFHTSQGVFCYRKMRFGLKNVRAIYQQLVDKAFDQQIGRNLEVYMDDLVIKSYSEEEIIRDIAVTFRTLRKINMKLNPRSAHSGRQKGSGKPQQTEEAEKALKAMKKQMAKLPTLTAPVEGETLIIYLIAAEEAISAVLLVKRALNNKAEYEALLVGLRIADSMRVKHIEAFTDSKLVGNQKNILYQAKEEAMQLYLRKAKDLITRFRSFSITQVPRSQNKQANALCKMASVSFAHLTKKVLVEVLSCKLIEEIEIMAIVEEMGNT